MASRSFSVSAAAIYIYRNGEYRSGPSGIWAPAN
jgi:hypothetical protein